MLQMALYGYSEAAAEQRRVVKKSRLSKALVDNCDLSEDVDDDEAAGREDYCGAQSDGESDDDGEVAPLVTKNLYGPRLMPATQNLEEITEE